MGSGEPLFDFLKRKKIKYIGAHWRDVFSSVQDEEQSKVASMISRLRKELNPKYDFLYEDSAVKRWIGEKLWQKEDIEISSFRKYMRILFDFANYVNKTSLLDVVAEVKNDPSKGRTILRNWYRKLVDKDKLNQGYAISELVVARELLLKNDADFDFAYPGRVENGENSPKFKLDTATLRHLVESLPEKSELRKYILFGKDCGLSTIDMLRIDVNGEFYDSVNKVQYDSIRKQVRSGKEFLVVALRRKKTDVPTPTFLGPEASNGIKMNNSDGRLLSWSTTSSIRAAFKIAKKIARQPALKPKDLRTWFDRRLTVAKVDKDMREVMMGHKIPGIRGYYELFTREELESRYVEAYPALRILA